MESKCQFVVCLYVQYIIYRQEFSLLNFPLNVDILTSSWLIGHQTGFNSRG